MARPVRTVGQIIPTNLHQEMERSYLEYAMSVIVGRALPDVRDGLKPVHRRILYAMYELGLTPDRPYRKCARVVGDVLGKYHPHGDQAVYDALVRMVQDFSSRYPLLAGHGNFGSIDNDPPAAMRYTETRLAPIGLEGLLTDISGAIVDFSDNFDSSQEEPTVLPAQLPILLLNGCSGIAVGMATNMPPHNLGEVVDGLIGLINKPQLSDAELFRLVPGPDFPTGGEILDSKGILQAYQTGRGLIPVRGVSHIETIKGEKKRSRSRTAIVVTELPYQINKASWIEKIAALVNAEKLNGISDLRDESDRTGMRVVIELKRDTDPNAILEKLYRMTPLQSNFGMISLALKDNQPQQLPLRQLLQSFLTFREETLMRQYDHELAEANRRREVLEGLLIGLQNLDALIAILRGVPDGGTAKQQLQAQLNLTPAQGDALLGMPMRRITGLEQEKLQQEHQALLTRIQTLQTLLGDRRERFKAMKKELRALKKKFSDPRRTKILQGMPEVVTPLADSTESDPPPSSESVAQNPTEIQPTSSPRPSQTLTLERETIHSTPDSTLFTPTADNDPQAVAPRLASDEPTIQTVQPENQAPQVSPPKQTQTVPQPLPVDPLTLFTPQTPPANAFISINLEQQTAWHEGTLTPEVDPEALTYQQIAIEQQETLVVITDAGKIYPIPVKNLPPLTLARISLWDLLPKSARKDAQQIIDVSFLPTTAASQVLLLTAQGRLKRLAVSEINELSNRGSSLIKCREGDRLQFVHWLESETPEALQNIVVATSSGRLLRFPLNEAILPLASRSAQGQPILRLRPAESLVGFRITAPSTPFLLLTALGYGKSLSLETVRLGKFGDLGTTVMQFTQKQDMLVAIIPATTTNPIALTNQNHSYPLNSDHFQAWGKDGPGDLQLALSSQETVIKVTSG